MPNYTEDFMKNSQLESDSRRSLDQPVPERQKDHRRKMAAAELEHHHVDQLSSATRQQVKLRVLIVSSVIPVEGSGAGCLTMYRHFVLNRDFDVAVATERDFTQMRVRSFRIKRDRFSERLRRSRFPRLAVNLEYVRNWYGVPKSLLQFAREFNPDVIFSVVDDWHMGLAWQLSRKLKIPLAVDFQDIFALSNFEAGIVSPYSWTVRYLVNRYHFLNNKAEVVFHVGEGMRSWFKGRERGHILYPIAHASDKNTGQSGSVLVKRKPIRLVYTGNCRGAYGRMVLKVGEVALSNPEIDFRIFSGGTDMPQEGLLRLQQAGIYRGYLPFEQLQSELEEADAFLIVMSFDERDRTFMETSFNTKWSDYLAQGKPIFVWGPGYSSANIFARQHQAAAVVEDNDPQILVRMVVESCKDPVKCEMLVKGARAATRGPLNPIRLQNFMKEKLEEAVVTNER
jgi:hypothetical protein